MLTSLIQVFTVFAVLYLIIEIVLQRRRDRLIRKRESALLGDRERTLVCTSKWLCKYTALQIAP